jgi:hypothetical protein
MFSDFRSTSDGRSVPQPHYEGRKKKLAERSTIRMIANAMISSSQDLLLFIIISRAALSLHGPLLKTV